MFSDYDERSCLFECRLRHAVNATSCLPFDYPSPLGEADAYDEVLGYRRTTAFADLPVCVSHFKKFHSIKQRNALAEFEAAMNSLDALDGCNCKPNCEEVIFKTQV